MQVSLNVYDVTNTTNENANGVISRLNSLTRDLNLGGVFHGAVELDGHEWSFGYCESGSGVYACHARSNGMYTFRESIELGVTHRSRQQIKEILGHLKREWQGTSYDLLQRNCCHFCEELCCALGVTRPPAWLNRFAQGADATVKFTNEASAWFKRLSTNVSITAQQNAQWLREMLLSNQRLQELDSAEEDEPGQGQGQLPNPLYSRGQSSNAEELGGQERGLSGSTSSFSGPWSMANRLPLFTQQGSAAGASGLPASTAASSSESPSRLGVREAVQAHSARLTSAVRNRLQELEATAGDGTKQFLFGLIKSRQSRLDEDDPPGVVTGDGAGSSGPAEAGAAYAAPAPPTQAPLPQVISHAQLPPDVVGATASGNSASAAWPPVHVVTGAPAGSMGSSRSWADTHLLDM